MKRVIACTAALAMVSGIAISETPDSRDSLEFSDFRESAGEARAFWQYNFGHSKTEVNGLRYGLRYDRTSAYGGDSWRAPMLEFVRNVNDELMPYELNFSGLNVLDSNYMLNADGGIPWKPIATIVVIGGATAYAVSSTDEGDDPPAREDNGGGEGDGGGGTLEDPTLAETAIDPTLMDPTVGETAVFSFGDWSLVSGGGNGYVPNEPLAPHQVEQLHTQK